MGKKSAKKPEWYPTSVRLPPDLKEDIDRERIKVQHTQSGFIISILRRWQEFIKAKRKTHPDD